MLLPLPEMHFLLFNWSNKLLLLFQISDPTSPPVTPSMSSSCFSLREVLLFCFSKYQLSTGAAPHAMGRHGPVSSFAGEGTEAQSREGMSSWRHIWWGTDLGPNPKSPKAQHFTHAQDFSMFLLIFTAGGGILFSCRSCVTSGEDDQSLWASLFSLDIKHNNTVYTKVCYENSLREFAINSTYHCFLHGLWLPYYFLTQVFPPGDSGFLYEEGKPREMAELLTILHTCSPTSSLGRTVIKPVFPPAKQSWSF